MTKGFRPAQVRRDSKGRFAPAKKRGWFRRLLGKKK